MSRKLLKPLLVLAIPAGCAARREGPPVVLDPHVATDRSVDCSTVDRILAGIIKPGMSDEQKVLAVHHWVRRLVYHGDGLRKYAYNFHYMINVLGNGSCERQTAIAAVLLDRLGYATQNWTRNGHHLMQVRYGGRWHCLDPHMNFYVYDRGRPRSLAGIEQLQEDASLALDAVKEGRAAPGFLLCGDSPKTFAGRDGWKKYGEFPQGFHKVTLVEPFGRITLRRGESYVRTWRPGEHWFKKNWPRVGGPYHSCGSRDRKDTVNWKLYEPHVWKSGRRERYRHWGAGRLVYKPNLAGGFADAVLEQKNLGGGMRGRNAFLRQMNASRAGEVVFSVNCPYVITAGELSLGRPGKGKLTSSVSTNGGKTWTPLKLAAKEGRLEAPFVDEINGSFEGYRLKLRVTGGALISGLELVSHFQLNPFSLPYLVPGRNVVRVRAGRYGAPLKVTYRWAEGPDWKEARELTRTFKRDGSFEVQVAGPKWPRMRSLALSVAP